MLSYSDIQAASVRLRDHVLRTPCVESQTLSHIVGAQVFLKFENLQFTASFKERGACNRLQLLSAEEKAEYEKKTMKAMEKMGQVLKQKMKELKK